MSTAVNFSKASLTGSSVLIIPCRLIWKVKIKRGRKIALALCLCLTIVVMVCTIARISGLSYHETVDATWETFWQFEAASLGLTLTSVAAFRSFFVTYRVSHNQQEVSDFEALRLLWAKLDQMLRRAFSTPSLKTSAWYTQHIKASDADRSPNGNAGMGLGDIERGTITGLRTFIQDYERAPTSASEIMSSQIIEEIDETRETWPLPNNVAIGQPAAGRKDHTAPYRQQSDRYRKTLVQKNSLGDGKIVAHKGSRRHDKELALRTDRRDDKILNSQDSWQRDKMTIMRPDDQHSGIFAIDPGDNFDIELSRPKAVCNLPTKPASRSIIATGDSDFDYGHWTRGNRDGKPPAKTKLGMMSKIKCGGLVFSAGFKAERFGEAK